MTPSYKKVPNTANEDLQEEEKFSSRVITVVAADEATAPTDEIDGAPDECFTDTFKPVRDPLLLHL